MITEHHQEEMFSPEEIGETIHYGIIGKAEDQRKALLTEQIKLGHRVNIILEGEKNTPREVLAELVLQEVERYKEAYNLIMK